MKKKKYPDDDDDVLFTYGLLKFISSPGGKDSSPAVTLIQQQSQ